MGTQTFQQTDRWPEMTVVSGDGSATRVRSCSRLGSEPSSAHESLCGRVRRVGIQAGTGTYRASSRERMVFESGCGARDELGAAADDGQRVSPSKGSEHSH